MKLTIGTVLEFYPVKSVTVRRNEIFIIGTKSVCNKIAERFSYPVIRGVVNRQYCILIRETLPIDVYV